jgi:HAE1 family hydrophobic/amphiphilic exporter-1
MGTGVIGGMLTASFIAIFLIPMTFYVVERLSHRGDSTKAHATASDPQKMSQKGGEHA